jgi:hypothetical protein
MLRHPTFAKAQDIQEDTYEVALNALKQQMINKKPYLERLLTGLADVAWQDLLARGTPVAVGEVYGRLWPAKYLREEKSEQDGFAGALTKHLGEQGLKMRNIMPMRAARGPLDLAYVYTGPKQARERIEGVQLATTHLGLWSAAGGQPATASLGLWPPRAPLDQLMSPAGADRFRRRLLLARSWYGQPPGTEGWEPLIAEQNRETVRARTGWTPPPQQQAPQQAPAEAKGQRPRRPPR